MWDGTSMVASAFSGRFSTWGKAVAEPQQSLGVSRHPPKIFFKKFFYTKNNKKKI